MPDQFTEALNAPSGRLAEILLKKLTRTDDGGEMSEEMQARFEKLIRAEGQFGDLARVRLAADVPFLFDRAPRWTTENILSLFDWSSPDARAAWSSRKYSTSIGSPELMSLVKEPFLQLFGRSDMEENDIETFADWLAAMMLANQSGETDYPINATEARASLCHAGARGMRIVAHRLARQMEKAEADQKIEQWRHTVGPVFQSIWPLDVELQSPSFTFKLVQILRATGAAFPEAADVIVPFIRPEDPRRHTSVYSISKAPDILYSSSPERMLDLLSAIVGDVPGRSFYAINETLERIRGHNARLADTRKFQRLGGADVTAP